MSTAEGISIEGSTQVWEDTLASQGTQPRPARGSESTSDIEPAAAAFTRAAAIPVEQELCRSPVTEQHNGPPVSGAGV